MHARIDNPAITVPGALQAMQGIANAAKQADILETTLYLVELRASQINGCGVCVDIHSRELQQAGEPDSASTRSPSGATSRTSPRPSAPLWHSPRRLLVSPTARTPFRTTYGTTPRATTTTRSSPRSSSDRRDQRLEPSQRHHEADQRGLGEPVDRPKSEGQSGSLTQAADSSSCQVMAERRRLAPLALTY